MIHSPRQRRYLALSAFLGSFTRAFRTPKPRQRGLKFKLCTAVATVMAVLVGTAAAAFANAANPLPDASGTANVVGGAVTQNPDGTWHVDSGTVNVSVGGTWNWGALSGSSAQSSCTSRFGVGWAVDWAGISNSASSSNPASLGSLTIGKKVGGGKFFHIFESDMIAEGNYYGFTGPCTPQELALEPGHPSGPWDASHTYSAGQTIPKELCVNMYDLHGSPGSLKAGDEDPLGNNDNSIRTNSFDPGVGGGYCFVPKFVKPNLQIKKSASATTVNAGDSFDYTLDVSNTGDGTALKATVTDTIPDGLAITKVTPSVGTCSTAGQNVSCALGDMAKAATAKIVINVKTSAAKCGTVTNTGTVKADNNAAVDSNKVDVTIICPNPALDIKKSASATTVNAGDPFDYTLVVTSTGGSTATNVVVTDTIPTGLGITGTATTSGSCAVSGQNLSCNVGDLVAANAANGTKSATITVHISTSTAVCGKTTNIGHAAANNVTNVDSNPVDVIINCPVDGDLDKTNDADGNGTYNKAETADLPGMDVPFRVVLKNTSAVPVVIDSISDAFGSTTINPSCAAAFLGQTVAPGASLTCDFIIPNYSPAAGDSLENEVTVTVHDAGDPGKTKTLKSTSTVNTAAAPPLTLTVVKTNDANNDTVFTKDETGAASADVKFRVEITNNSAVPVVIDSVTDVWPGVTEFAPACAATIVGQTLAAHGGTVTCDFTVATYVPVSNDAAKVNTVTVTGHQPGNPGNTTTKQDTSTVRGPAVLGTTVVRALPRTGSNTFGLVGIAMLLLVVGAGLMLLGSGRIPQAALALRSSAFVVPVMYSRSALVIERKLGEVSRRKLKGR